MPPLTALAPAAQAAPGSDAPLPDLAPLAGLLDAPPRRAEARLHAALAAVHAGRPAAPDARDLAAGALEGDALAGSMLVEFLARALAAHGQPREAEAALALLRGCAEGGPVLRLRASRGAAFAAARAGGDGFPAVVGACEAVQDLPHGDERTLLAELASCTAADYAVFADHEPAARLALVTALHVPKSRGREEHVARLARKLALRDERAATSQALLGVAREGLATLQAKDEVAFTRMQLAVAAGQLGEREHAQRELADLERDLGPREDLRSLGLYPAVFRARVQAGLWGEAAPMLGELEKRFAEGMERLAKPSTMFRQMQSVLGRLPPHILQNLDGLASFGRVSAEGVVVALSTAGAWGPAEARGCLGIAGEMVRRAGEPVPRFKLALHVLELAWEHEPALARAALGAARDAAGGLLRQPTQPLEDLVTALLNAAARADQAEPLEEAAKLLRAANLDTRDRDAMVLAALGHWARLAEDRCGGVLFFHG